MLGSTSLVSKVLPETSVTERVTIFSFTRLLNSETIMEDVAGFGKMVIVLLVTSSIEVGTKSSTIFVKSCLVQRSVYCKYAFRY